MEEYKVYVKTDEEGRITAINSSAFVEETAGWTEIDQGIGDQYHHAQGNYLDKGIITEAGIWQYKLEGGKAVERTAEEIAADIAAQPEPEPTMEERLQSQLDALAVAVLEGGNS